MKRLKKILLLSITFLVVIVLFRGVIYRNLIQYKSVRERITYNATNKKLINFINTKIKTDTTQNINQLITLSNSITRELLNFSNTQKNSNPNKLIDTKSAHCVGYASLFVTTFNYILIKKKLTHKWIAKPKIGKIYFLERDIHKHLDSPFFKDHDFVVIENKITKEKIAVDPSLNDYLFIDYVTLKQ